MFSCDELDSILGNDDDNSTSCTISDFFESNWQKHSVQYIPECSGDLQYQEYCTGNACANGDSDVLFQMFFSDENLLVNQSSPGWGETIITANYNCSGNGFTFCYSERIVNGEVEYVDCSNLDEDVDFTCNSNGELCGSFFDVTYSDNTAIIVFNNYNDDGECEFSQLNLIKID